LAWRASWARRTSRSGTAPRPIRPERPVDQAAPRACRTIARPRSVAGHHPAGPVIGELPAADGPGVQSPRGTAGACAARVAGSRRSPLPLGLPRAGRPRRCARWSQWPPSLCRGRSSAGSQRSRAPDSPDYWTRSVAAARGCPLPGTGSNHGRGYGPVGRCFRRASSWSGVKTASRVGRMGSGVGCLIAKAQVSGVAPEFS